jgi:hypothetical protein
MNRTHAFLNGPTDTALYDLRVLPVTSMSSLLHPHLTSRKVTNITLHFPGASLLEAVLTLRICHESVPMGVVVTTATSGTPTHGEATYGSVYSGIGDEGIVYVEEDEGSGVDFYIGPPDDYSGSGTMIDIREDRSGDFPALAGLIATAQAEADSADKAWSIKVLDVQPETGSNTDPFYLRDDDGDLVEVASGRLELAGTPGVTVTNSTSASRHLHLIAQVGFPDIASGDGTLTLSTHGGDVVATMKVEKATSDHDVTLTLNDNAGTASTKVITGVAPIDDVHRLEVIAYEGVVELLLDGIRILGRVPTATPDSGDLTISYAGAGSLDVYDVVVRRLRYDGAPLEELLYETFEDGTAWSLGTATISSHTHNVLDLSFLGDVLLQLDYKGLLEDWGNEA